MSRRYAMRLRRPRFRGIRTPVVTPRHSVRRLVLLGIAAAALVVPFWAGTTQTFAGQWLAELILYGRGAVGVAVLGTANEILAALSLAFVAMAVIGLAAIGLARGGFGLATAALTLIIGANLTTQALKVMLDRPNLIGDAAFATGNSFPSGTVSLAASLGLACILVMPRRIRTPVALLVAVSIAAVGASTIIAAWHRLADVEAGILIPLAWASLVTASLVRAQGWMPRRTFGRGLGGRAATLVVVAGALAVIAGGAGVAITLVEPTPLTELIASRSSPPGSFVAALAIAVGTSLIACAAYVWAMLGVALELPG